jgi:hypothetical protein
MTPTRMIDLHPGSDVLANDGTRVATIQEVGHEYIVAVGRRGSPLLYIPVSAVGNVKGGVVCLNVASRAVAGMGWEVPPRTEDAPEPTAASDLHRHV